MLVPECCPFCGSDRVQVVDKTVRSGPGHDRHVRAYVRCRVCNSRGPLSHSRDRAVEHWNGEARFTSMGPLFETVTQEEVE